MRVNLGRSSENSESRFHNDKNIKVFGVFALVVFGLTSFDSSLFQIPSHEEIICMPIYNPVENRTDQNCVYWNSTGFLLGYTPKSMNNTVIEWLKTELHATDIRDSMYRPFLSFDTNMSLGIYGSYVLERVANQEVFDVRYISYDPCAIGHCYTF